MYIKKVTISGYQFTDSYEFNDRFNVVSDCYHAGWILSAFQIIFGTKVTERQISTIFRGDYDKKCFISVIIDNSEKESALINKIPEASYNIVFHPDHMTLIFVNGTPLKRFMFIRQLTIWGLLWKTQQQSYLNVILSQADMNEYYKLSTKNIWNLISHILKHQKFEILRDQQLEQTKYFDFLEKFNKLNMDEMKEQLTYLEERVKNTKTYYQNVDKVIVKQSQINAYNLRKSTENIRKLEVKINALIEQVTNSNKKIDEMKCSIEIYPVHKWSIDYIKDLIDECEYAKVIVNKEVEGIRLQVRNIDKYERLLQQYNDHAQIMKNKLKALNLTSTQEIQKLHTLKLDIELLRFKRIANLLIAENDDTLIDSQINDLNETINQKKELLKRNKEERMVLRNKIRLIQDRINGAELASMENSNLAAEKFLAQFDAEEAVDRKVIRDFMENNVILSTNLKWYELYTISSKYNIDIDAIRGIIEIKNCVHQLIKESMIDKTMNFTVFEHVLDSETDKIVSKYLYKHIESIFTVMIFKHTQTWQLVKERLSNNYKYNVVVIDNFFTSKQAVSEELSRELNGLFGANVCSIIYHILSHNMKNEMRDMGQPFVIHDGYFSTKFSVTELKAAYKSCFNIIKNHDDFKQNICQYMDKCTKLLNKNLTKVYLEQNSQFVHHKQSLEYYEIFRFKSDFYNFEQKNTILKLEVERWQNVCDEYQSLRDRREQFPIDAIETLQNLNQRLKIAEIELKEKKNSYLYVSKSNLEEFYNNLKITDTEVDILISESGILEMNKEIQMRLIAYNDYLYEKFDTSVDLLNETLNKFKLNDDLDTLLSREIAKNMKSTNEVRKISTKLDGLRQLANTLNVEKHRLSEERKKHCIYTSIDGEIPVDEVNRLMSVVGKLKKKIQKYPSAIEKRKLRQIESAITNIRLCIANFNMYETGFSNSVLPCISKITCKRIQFILEQLSAALKVLFPGDGTARVVCQLTDQNNEETQLTQYVRLSNIDNIQILYDKSRLAETSTTEISQYTRILLILSILRTTNCPFLIIKDFAEHAPLNEFFQCFAEHMQVIKLAE